MYVHRALAGSVALAVLAAVLFVYSLTGSWLPWEGDQLLRYVAGVVAIAAITGSVAQYREWECRKVWVSRGTASDPS